MDKVPESHDADTGHCWVEWETFPGQLVCRKCGVQQETHSDRYCALRGTEPQRDVPERLFVDVVYWRLDNEEHQKATTAHHWPTAIRWNNYHYEPYVPESRLREERLAERERILGMFNRKAIVHAPWTNIYFEVRDWLSSEMEREDKEGK